jgi:Fic family protein
MGNLERFLHGDPAPSRTLVKAALAHAQFETIHPFLDGNGRVGRLLITLLLCAEDVLSRPLLYLSLFLKRNRDTYYDCLQRIRTHGAWEEWIQFFLEGVVEVAQGATQTTRTIVGLIDEDRRRIHGLKRAAATALRLHEDAVVHVLLTGPRAAQRLGVSEPTIYKAIGHLVDLGVLQEMTGNARGRVWAYGRYLNALTEGT